jgi:hypothetical protein
MLAAALPVTPSLGLKGSVLGALGFGGGAAGGGGAILGGAGVAATAPIGATVAKVAVVAALAGGGVVAGERALQPGDSGSAGPVAAAAAPVPPAERAEARSQGRGADESPERSRRASKRFHSSEARRRKARAAHGRRDTSEPKVKAKGRSRESRGLESAARTPTAKHRGGALSETRSKPRAAPKARHREPDLSAESGQGTASAPGQAKARAD